MIFVDAVQLFNFLKMKILNEDSLSNTMLHMTSPMEHPMDAHSRRRIPASNEFDILFTVLNPEPELLAIEFNIPEAIEGSEAEY